MNIASPYPDESSPESSLGQRLNALYRKILADVSIEDRRVLVAALESLSERRTLGTTLGVGDQAVDFSLTTSSSQQTRLSTELRKGPVVLFFQRAPWCPFCQLTLASFAEYAGRIREAGAIPLVVTPVAADAPREDIAKLEQDPPMLPDSGMKVAKSYGLLLSWPRNLLNFYRSHGLPPRSASIDSDHVLPVPAIYIIAPDGRIRLASLEKDFTRRLDPGEIVRFLNTHFPKTQSEEA